MFPRVLFFSPLFFHDFPSLPRFKVIPLFFAFRAEIVERDKSNGRERKEKRTCWRTLKHCVKPDGSCALLQGKTDLSSFVGEQLG